MKGQFLKRKTQTLLPIINIKEMIDLEVRRYPASTGEVVESENLCLKMSDGKRFKTPTFM